MTERSDSLQGLRGSARERETYRVQMEKGEGDMPTQGRGRLPQSVVGRAQGADFWFCFWKTLHLTLLILFQDSYYLFCFRVGEMDTSLCSNGQALTEPEWLPVMPEGRALLPASWRAHNMPACSQGALGGRKRRPLQF